VPGDLVNAFDFTQAPRPPLVLPVHPSPGPASNPPGTGQVRPRGATPLRASLVPAYQQCATPNRTHGAPLSFDSCNPPVQASPNLTFGTPDSNGAQVHGTGAVLLRAQVNPSPIPNDLLINVTTTDVRCQAGVSACGAANAAAGPDYIGQLQATAQLRITDQLNGPSQDVAATVSDTSFPVTVPCAATADVNLGATCSVATSASAVVPGAGPGPGVRRWRKRGGRSLGRQALRGSRALPAVAAVSVQRARREKPKTAGPDRAHPPVRETHSY
jgi:hypothetical protein